MEKRKNYLIMPRIITIIDLIFAFVIVIFGAVNKYIRSNFEIVNLQDFLNSHIAAYSVFIISNFTLFLFPVLAVVLLLLLTAELIKFIKMKNDIQTKQYKRNIIYSVAIVILTVLFVIYDVKTVISGF